MKVWQKLKTDPQLKNNLATRTKVIDAIRLFFKWQKYLEVETPILVNAPSTESNIDFFQSRISFLDQKKHRGFLISSPEFAIKKLLASHPVSMFEITKSFRNHEGVSSTHNHEFTILEWYHVQADYTQVMIDFENLMKFIFGWLTDQLTITYRQQQWSVSGFDELKTIKLSYLGKKIDLTPPWERLSIQEAFQRYADIDEATLLDKIGLIKAAGAKGYRQITNWEEAFDQILLNEIEPHLGQNKPTILYDYPIALGAYAQAKKSDPRYAERFEVFVHGLELGNAFSEITDAKVQADVLDKDANERQLLGKQRLPIDKDFLAAMMMGLPKVSGIAVGVDRLVMLFTDSEKIEDVIMFPVKDMFL